MNAQWSPCGRYLWAGGRASSELSCWDLRQTREKVGSVERDLQVGQQVRILKCYYYYLFIPLYIYLCMYMYMYMYYVRMNNSSIYNLHYFSPISLNKVMYVCMVL